MEIEEVPFSELIAEVVDNRGRSCPTVDRGIPLIATNCIRNELLYPTYEKARFVSQETYSTWFRGHPRPGDILFVNKATPGRVCLVPDPVDFCIAQDMVAIRADEEKIYPKYLFAALRSPIVQERIVQMHVGTLIPHFKRGDFDKLLIPVPSPGRQVVLGDTYFRLSAKIDLNRRMNETLEAMACALFRSWFVDFEPVRAKAEGRQPDLPKPLAELFPDALEDSELGEIPKGWPARPLSEVLSETTERVGGAVVLEYSSTNDGLRPRSERFIKKLSASSANNKMVRKGELVFGLSRRVLNFGLMRDDIGSVSSAYRVLAVDDGSIAPDLLEQMMRMRPAYYYGAVSGSSREGQSVSMDGLALLRFVQPAKSVQEAYYRSTTSLLGRARGLEKESHTLAEIRDALLFKLICGDLRVKESSRTTLDATS